MSLAAGAADAQPEVRQLAASPAIATIGQAMAKCRLKRGADVQEDSNQHAAAGVAVNAAPPLPIAIVAPFNLQAI